jgi:outer membrane protein assembly factor BamB
MLIARPSLASSLCLASVAATFVCAGIFGGRLQAGDNWAQFRGPSGDGHSDAKELPVTFGESERVKWKTAIHGKAWSSPVIWGDQVWLTTATEAGDVLSVVCINKESGAIIRDEVLFRVAEPQFCHKFNSYASPTPVIEEGRVYVTFGSPGTACLDTKTGAVLWKRTDFVCNHFRAAGSSPILHGDLLYLNFDGSDFQFVAALDKKTGRTVWKVDRSVDFQDLDAAGRPAADGDFRKAFSTPHIISQDGRPILLSSGAKAHYAYEPATGAEIWRFEERGQHSASSRPLVAHGLVYLQTGFSKSQLLAVKLGGVGVLPESQVVWREKKNVPNKPSMIAHEDLLFMVDDVGIASCLEAKTGTMLWRERVLGSHSASPLLAEGRIYFFSEHGIVTVIAAARTFQKLTENKFSDGFMASPAVSGKALFLRTKSHLYRVE